MTFTQEQIKNKVKSHTVVPFSTRDISATQNELIINDRYHTNVPRKVMDTLGIKTNLSKDIFNKPAENWTAIRTALQTIDPNKKFGCIVDGNGNICTLVNTRLKEPTQLNFDDRLDQLFDVIDNGNSYSIKDIFWDIDNCNVNVSTVNTGEVDCGLNDIWNFGTTTTIGHTNQTFANYFLRLICTNGMTTRENIAYRSAEVSKNIGKQFAKFANNDTFSRTITTRVNALRNSRASLYEVNSIANQLNVEQREQFMPFYSDIMTDFTNAGHPINNISAKRQRMVYTNENLYDIFNIGTNLASHERDVIGIDTALQMNKAAGEMFSNGPNLQFDLLDIYKN
jgi:hypothetical protein